MLKLTRSRCLITEQHLISMFFLLSGFRDAYKTIKTFSCFAVNTDAESESERGSKFRVNLILCKHHKNNGFSSLISRWFAKKDFGSN